MATDTYLVNGTDLSGLAWRIDTAEGHYDAAGQRGDDLTVPGAHGTLDAHADPAFARRRYGPARIRFSMWVLGVDPATGVAPADEDDPTVFLGRIDDLQALFNARTLTVTHQVTGGVEARTDTNRVCTARLAEPVQVVREPASPMFGRFVADCVIPAGFWMDDTPVTVASGSVTTGATISLATLAGTAPITDAVVTFGPCSNPRLTVGGSHVQYNGVVTAGRQLEVRTGVWELDDGSGTAWTPALADISYDPGPSWLEIDSTVSPLQATFAHTGGGTATVSITAYRKWLTS